MKVLIIVGLAGLGGHLRTALTIGRELARQGADIYFASGLTKKTAEALIKDSGLPFRILPLVRRLGEYRFNNDTQAELEKFAEEIGPDVIHAFDLVGLCLGFNYAYHKKIKLVYTICGGAVPKYPIPNMRPIIVFSKEQKMGIPAKHNVSGHNLLINPGRIELNQPLGAYPPKKIAAFKQGLGIPENVPIILMITRIHQSKKESLKHMMAAVDIISRVKNLCLLVVGNYDHQDIYDELNQCLAAINETHKKRLIVLTDRGSLEASELLPLATIAVGVGRTAYEAMAQGIPTLVIGEYGFTGLAIEDNCSRMAEQNFSGREALNYSEADRSPFKTAETIERLLLDQAFYKKAGASGQKWVRANMDVSTSCKMYLVLYQKELKEAYLYPKLINMRKIYFFLWAQPYYRFIRYSVLPKILYMLNRLKGI